MAPCFPAGDPPIAIVVVFFQDRIVPSLLRHRGGMTYAPHRHGRGFASRQDMFNRIGLSGINGEPVLASNLQGSSRIPAGIHLWNPFGEIFRRFPVPVCRGAGQRQVQQVSRKLSLDLSAPGTKATVVGLGQRNDMLDIRLVPVLETGARVRAVDDSAQALNDLQFDGLGIGVVLSVVGRATMFRSDSDAPVHAIGRMSQITAKMQHADDACCDEHKPVFGDRSHW